jgi:hypothetical protein
LPEVNRATIHDSSPIKKAMKLPYYISLALLVPSLILSATAADPKPVLVDVRRIWNEAPHSAFPDLIRFREAWWSCFREADGHVGGDGRVRILRSDDGLTWTPAALVSETDVDLRDPKLSITPDGRLMIVAGGSIYLGTTQLKGRQPRVMFSADGVTWSEPEKVLQPDEWLWRVTWHEGRAYGVSYNAAQRATPAAREAAKSEGPVPAGPADWKLKLVTSTDGKNWDLVSHLDVPGNPNETTLRFLADGAMMAMVRREAGSKMGWIGVSQAPYRTWTWHETGHRFGGPNFIVLPDGSLVAGSRGYPAVPGQSSSTVLAAMDRTLFQPVLTLPSGGDNSYPGLVWHDGLLWVCYYSSHEGKSAIYLARVRWEQQR